MELTSCGNLLIIISIVSLNVVLIYGNGCYSQSYCNHKGCYSNGRCHCYHGYGGSRCEFIDPCHQKSPCHNGGICHFTTKINHHYYCTCPEGYHGTTCSVTDPCYQKTQCHNGGTCHFFIVNPQHFYCSCPLGYYGNTCSERISHTVTQKPVQTTTKGTTTSQTTTRPTTTTTDRSTTTTMQITTPRYRECFELPALIDISNGNISSNGDASVCQIGGERTGSEAFVLNHCRVTSPTLWAKGRRVLDICNELPLYRAIASFNYGDRYVIGDDLSGIFLGCTGDEIQIGIQTCDQGLNIRRFSRNVRGREDASLYFTIL